MNDAIRRQGSKEGPDGRWPTIAARQHGVITRQQALSTGLSPRSLDRRLASGRLEAMHRGVYRISGSQPSWQQRLLAACLWADGVASHRAAAALWQLEGSWPAIVEITTARRVESSTVTRHMTRLSRRDVTSIGPIPVTTVVRTLLDLGSVIPRRAVEAAVTDALRTGLATTERLQRCLREGGGRGRRGTKVLRAILEVLDGQRPESVLELKLVRLIRRSGLPEPVSQHEIRKGGKLVARVDLAYPSIRLAIEADGYRYHGEPDAWRRDLGRRNALTALGWHTVHFTWDDVSTRPNEVVRQIRGIMLAPKR